MLRILRGLWGLLDRPQRRQAVSLQVLSLLMAASTVLGMAAVLPLFAMLADPQFVHRTPLAAKAYEVLGFTSEHAFVIALGIAFVALMLCASVVNLIGSFAFTRFAQSISARWHAMLFQEYLERGLGFHLSTSSTTLVARVLHETGRVCSGILQRSLAITANLLTILCIAVCSVLVNAWLSAAATVVLIGSYLLIYRVFRPRLLANGANETRLHAERLKLASDAFTTIREVTLLSDARFVTQRFARACDWISRSIATTLMIAQAPKYLLEFVTVTVLVASAILLTLRGRALGDSLAQLAFIGLAAYRVLPALQQVFGALVQIRADSAAFDSIHADLLAARARECAGPQPLDPSWRGRPLREIAVREVSFRYGATLPQVLKAVSLTIPAGSIAGLTGDNGSGKTTLADLIMALLAPEQGSIEVDGVPVSAQNERSWRNTIACVPQNVVVLEATLAENIAFGVAPADIDRYRLEAAAALARLDGLAGELPGGFEAMIGPAHVWPSGGWRQRIGIARALYREPSLLVLDEPGTALDGAAEQDLTTTIAGLRGKCTVLVIAHRAETLRACDLLFELRAGRLVASGRPDQVLGVAARSPASNRVAGR